ncbi:hypothetical protein FK220_017455 [Flavobacteriaceae bacterium TP-CH-4]|uniref:DUF5683 domain-containing protein n=1 Tax=Pelagihabitans pacificus TaxID=2696054 RepID=A0A967EF87_9FLAO|nr:hypothetical protein [Pelagihabitans pacificus]
MLLLPLGLLAQEKEPQDREVDSLQNDLKKKGIVVQDSVIEKRKPINPLAPSRAAFYSAVLPGMGQIYNKRYWKVPIIYGVLGAGVYIYNWNDERYDRFRTAFKRRQAGFIDDEFYDPNGDGSGPDFDDDVLQDQQERFQRDRDLALVITIGLYILNIVDANVDAHLKQFNISDDLSFDVQPFLELNTVDQNPNYGMAFVIKF